MVPKGRTINNLFGFSVEEAGCNKNLTQQQRKNSFKKTVTLNELRSMFDLLSEYPWHAVCVINDEMSQTTITLLGHIEKRMTETANALTPGLPVGGHAMTLVGDFFQKTPPGNASMFTSMVDRYMRLPDKNEGTLKQRSRWESNFDNDTPMERGTHMLRAFTMVALGAQMRSKASNSKSGYKGR